MGRSATTSRLEHAGGGPVSPLRDIGGVAMFAGAVRPTPLLRLTARSVLDLPLPAGVSVGGRWLAGHEALCERAARELPLTVLVDRFSPKPTLEHPAVRVRTDEVAFVGTGGVLRAAAADEAGWLLVLTAGAVALRPLDELASELASLEADVALLAEPDGRPAGIMLARAEVLAALPDRGYQDFKEQCLPEIARFHDVRVLRSPTEATLPVRDLESYLAALRRLAGGVFSVAEPGASVAGDARLHEAVVLSGASVGAGAVVARSVVGGGGRVAPGAVVTDRTLGGEA